MILLAAAVFEPVSGPPASAQTTTDPGVIAYVKRSTGDIHLISPDGTNDRVLWTNPDPDSSPISLAWRPDGRELAFSSQHEWTCSLYDGDVYAIRSDGTGYRRVTNAPACAELASLPKGTVTVQVQDLFGDSFVYVAGAPGLKRSQLGTMTFDNVADFGPGVLQPSVGIAGLDRVIGYPPYADVLPGQTVPGGTLIINDTSSIRSWGAGKVSWKADGAMLGYNMRTCSEINAIAAAPGYGRLGDALPVVPDASPCLHSLNPTLAGSNQYLYYSSDWYSDEAHGIFLNTVGNASGGTRIYHPPWPLFFQMLDIEWLPDGSGFLFSMWYMSGWDPVYTCAGQDYHSCNNIFEYDLASGQITQRTDIDDRSVNRMTISPDGEHIIFERTTDPVFDPTSSLWIINRDGSGLHKLADDAGRPAWGQTPAPFTPRAYLPIVLK
jgi:TolB protein